MTTFTELLSAIAIENGVHRLTTPPSWMQGRTLYGGISAALCFEAVKRDFPDLPPLRSAQIAFVGPSGGDITMATRLLRRGKSAAFVASDLSVDGEVGTVGLFCFGSERLSLHRLKAPAAPEVPSPNDCPTFFPPDRYPQFIANFDLRLARGAPPVSGAQHADNIVWARHRDRQAPSTLTKLLALVDAAPPAAISLMSEPAPISTMTWSLDVVSIAEQDGADNGWCLCQSTADTIGDGYSCQSMSVWGANGTPLLLGRQTIAMFT